MTGSWTQAVALGSVLAVNGCSEKEAPYLGSPFTEAVIAATDITRYEEWWWGTAPSNSQHVERIIDARWRANLDLQLNRSMTQAVIVAEGFIDSVEDVTVEHSDGHNRYRGNIFMIRPYRIHKGEGDNDLLPVSGVGDLRPVVEIEDGRPFTLDVRVHEGDRVLVFIEPSWFLRSSGATNVFFYQCDTTVVLRNAIEQQPGTDAETTPRGSG